MLLAALALAAQGPALPADNAKAGLMCSDAWVVAAKAANVPRFAMSSAVGYYLMASAAADLQGKPFLQRVGEVTSTNQPKEVALADAQSLMPQCDQRFPMARTKTLPALPADPLDRDVLCFAMTGIQAGAAQGMANELHDDSELKRWNPVQTAYSERLGGDRFQRAGLDEPGIDAAFSRVMLASLKIGNIDTLSRACAAALRG